MAHTRIRKYNTSDIYPEQNLGNDLCQAVVTQGSKMEHLVKVVVYITDVRHREDVYGTIGEYIKGVHPVSSGLVVQALARPDWLAEIDGTAVIQE